MSQHRQTILIVGGTAGIGRATAEQILMHRITARRYLTIVLFGLQEGTEVPHPANESECTIVHIYGDVTNEVQRREVVSQCQDKYGGIDTLIYCAGIITPIARSQDLQMEDVKRTFDVNVFGAMAMVQLCLPHLRNARLAHPLNAGYGKIIILSSACDSDITYHGWMPYCTSKAALTRFVACLAHEEPFVLVQGVYPKLTRTKMPEGVINGNHDDVMADHEIERFRTWNEMGDEMIEPPELCGAAVAKLALGVVEGKKSGETAYYDEHVPRTTKGT